MKKLKKWNWSSFFVIILLCAIGATGNKSVDNFIEGLLLTLMFGVPLGLLFAWMASED